MQILMKKSTRAYFASYGASDAVASQASPRILSILIALLVLLLAAVHPSPARAQADASSLSGTVTDSSGAVIVNARVTAHNDATGQDSAQTTNSSGAYTFPSLAAGDYTVKVEAQGFATTVQNGTHLDPNIGSRYDATLKAGQSHHRDGAGRCQHATDGIGRRGAVGHNRSGTVDPTQRPQPYLSLAA